MIHRARYSTQDYGNSGTKKSNSPGIDHGKSDMSDRMTFTKKKLATLGSLLFGTVIILAVSISSNAAPMYKWKDAECFVPYGVAHPDLPGAGP